MSETFFDLPEEKQIEYQRKRMAGMKTEDGTPLYPVGTAFHAYVKNHETQIISTRVVEV